MRPGLSVLSARRTQRAHAARRWDGRPRSLSPSEGETGARSQTHDPHTQSQQRRCPSRATGPVVMGVWPLLVCLVGSAPASRRAFTVGALPASASWCRSVQPRSLVEEISDGSFTSCFLSDAAMFTLIGCSWVSAGCPLNQLFSSPSPTPGSGVTRTLLGSPKSSPQAASCSWSSCRFIRDRIKLTV